MQPKIEYFRFQCPNKGRVLYKKTEKNVIILAVDKKILAVQKANYLNDLPMHRTNKIDENVWIKEYSLFMRQI